MKKVKSNWGETHSAFPQACIYYARVRGTTDSRITDIEVKRFEVLTESETSVGATGTFGNFYTPPPR